ncbi:MAG: IS66 family transposase, partial [Planctomycetota bacterium]
GDPHALGSKLVQDALERQMQGELAVHQLRLHKAQCVCCGQTHTATTPPVAMPRGSMTAALLAYVVNGKFALHLPLKRILDELAAQGMRIPKSTMSNAMRHVASLLTPVVDRIVAALFDSPLLHLDGTGVDALHPGRRGKHRGQIAVCCNEQLTAYVYSPTKEGKYLRSFLGVGKPHGFRGKLVADAANNMDQLYGDGIEECGCWYHARDKFEKAVAGSPSEAQHALAWMGTMFDVEKAGDRAGDTAAERLARRKRDSIPLLRGFYRWMRATQPRFDPSEEFYKAVQYCLNHWCALTRFMTDGLVPMTNNLAERELGPIGRGRKNWLFAGSDAGGSWLATLHTVVRTCVRLSIAPDDYLQWVLPKLSDLPVNRGKGHLRTLTPMAYAETKGAI